MFFLISLKTSGQKKIVPIKWVNNINLPILLNYGVTFYKKKEHLVYISNDINDEPDFTLEVLDSIENNQPALYKSFVLKCFGELLYIKLDSGPKTKNKCEYSFHRFVRNCNKVLQSLSSNCIESRR